MKRLIAVFTLFFAIFHLSVSQQYYFKKYQVEDGLAYNTVRCTMQDSYGFIWMGTGNGLSKFDGARFTNYRNKPDCDNSLGENHIRSLYEDKDRNLWVGTNNGIYIYHRNKDSFTRFDKRTEFDVTISSTITKMIEAQDGKIWIATLGQGLFVYDKLTDRLTQNSRYTSFIWDISEDNRHRIYVSSIQDGLISFDKELNFIEIINPVLQHKLNEGDRKVHSILAKRDYVWFSIGTNTIIGLNTRTKEIQQYSNEGYSMGTVRSMASFSEHELLIGTDLGLYIFDTLQKKFTRIDNPMDSRSLSDLSINHIFQDTEGGFWLSTDLGGVNYLSQQTRVFEYYHPFYQSDLGKGKVINQFCEDSNGNIWVGTQDGLKFLDTKKNDILSYPLPHKQREYDVRSLLLDDNKLWVGTLGYGIMVLDLKNNKLREYTSSYSKARSIKSNDITCLYKCKNGEIFVGTSWGLCKYVVSSNDFDNFTLISTMVYITDMVEDNDNILWISTQNSGVYRYDTNTQGVSVLLYNKDDEKSIPSNTIKCLLKDNKGKIWFGTDGKGLCHYDKSSESFITHAESKSLFSNEAINSIEQDDKGQLWIATNSGLICLNNLSQQETEVKLFTKENGIQSNQFNIGASLKSSIGKLYFGGINGFNAFYPDKLRKNEYIPPVYVTRIKLSNKEGEINIFEQMNEVVLPYDLNSFSIEYSALSYEEPKRNRYLCKLEGVNAHWVHNEGKNSLSYTNLPPGKYEFRVIGSNNDGIHNNEGALLTIRIAAPWWLSKIAYLVYFIIIATLLYLVFYYWNKRAYRHAQKQILEYEKEKEKELYQSKIVFFTNLVHEIRTPLSLIKLPLDKIYNQNNNLGEVNFLKYLDIIDKNVEYLLGIVNQILDYQKAESATPKLCCQNVEVNAVIEELYNKFESYAELKGIKLYMELPDESQTAEIDISIIDKIVFNLIDNAIKYAMARVDIVLEYTFDNFIISVIDDGIGIADNEQEKIFEPFYQVNNQMKGGTGIGLAFSNQLAVIHGGILFVEECDVGAHFKLSIPYRQLKVAATLNQDYIQHVIAPINAVTSQRRISFKSNTILLVEDNVELLELIRDSLQQHFKILTAKNGEHALDMLQDNNVDVIVSDIMMPVMNGLILCKTIKSNINYSHIPVILLTAKASLDAKVEGMEYGADVYIEKPFSMRHVQIQIENLLKLRYAFQQQLTTKTHHELDKVAISGKDRDFLLKLEEEIDKHIANNDFYIESIAETMFMSRSSFYRKIKSLTGLSPSEFLKTIRLNKAATTLREGSYNISEIYDMVGFSSSSYFAKCFKAQFGVTPKDYASASVVTQN